MIFGLPRGFACHCEQDKLFFIFFEIPAFFSIRTVVLLFAVFFLPTGRRIFSLPPLPLQVAFYIRKTTERAGMRRKYGGIKGELDL